MDCRRGDSHEAAIAVTYGVPAVPAADVAHVILFRQNLRKGEERFCAGIIRDNDGGARKGNGDEGGAALNEKIGPSIIIVDGHVVEGCLCDHIAGKMK